ncbi:glutathione-S-transferase/glutaredoxin [Trypanosoma rangeli]|uniref:Glutathione-S-transferase/glutaredoxin n=1 Tax=Trypanosoma rangeli TaxID=5698 RepID=A0A422MZ79_TRYRA|nr:glutathione-S-transferase/glutaredoxin [Trypanosoma rangeli]RNE98544.1 glutathione-S-transferase/glutaredoxin [Trypanosoma rangeli]|eukprot:RNE98544.1 glutathione-S-transferase/glutaredoxin [Trypanosoma rangeli]
MRWGARGVGVALVGGGALGGATLWYATRGGAAGNTPPPQLSADEFNALQNEALLAEAFGAKHLPWNPSPQGRRGGGSSREGRDFSLTLYRLLGCPYCAKVEWVLRYHSVSFTPVDVDTLSGAGLPDPRYSLVPQISLAPIADAESSAPADAMGVCLVDSQRIISAISVPLGFSEQLKEPRVVETRRWITERFQAVSFIASNNTWRNAFASYPYVTPPRYHNIVFRIVGASALCVLSRYKILPGLVAKGADARDGLSVKDPAAWLEGELAAFTARLPGRPPQRFHGGKEPDVADVEMYAVTRVLEAHPRLRHVLHQGAFGEWSAAMEDEMRRRMQLKA